jgi:hypothetical protein
MRKQSLCPDIRNWDSCHNKAQYQVEVGGKYARGLTAAEGGFQSFSSQRVSDRVPKTLLPVAQTPSGLTDLLLIIFLLFCFILKISD